MGNCSCNAESDSVNANILPKLPENAESKVEVRSDVKKKDIEAITLANLVQTDDDLSSTTKEFENFLKSDDININEKLRLALLILRSKTEPEDGTFNDEISTKRFKEVFMGLVEEYYQKLLGVFIESKKGFRALIKLIQVFELMLENFEDKSLETHKESLQTRFKAVINKMKYSDWRYLRKLYDQSENLKIEKISFEMDLVHKFLSHMNMIKKALVWKKGTKSMALAEKVVDSLFELEKRNKATFIKCLMNGRFEKNSDLKIGYSLILGDEGGLYLLLNSVSPGSEAEQIILEVVRKDFLEDKRSSEPPKVILGQGAFGKVRLALSIFGNLKVDIGQLVCVKKSLFIGQQKRRNLTTSLGDITDSCFEDFFVKKLNESVYAPKSIDMAIISSVSAGEKHRKAYLLMEIVPQNMADQTFDEPKYQKWEYQKPFIIDVLKTMKYLLLEQRVFNSDLKPQNTLFDPLSRKMAIIDLGSSLFIEKGLDIEKFDVSVGGFGKTDQYCPPEILQATSSESDDVNTVLDLKKSISYLSGVTIAEITSILPKEKNEKKIIDKWLIGQKTDLDENLKTKLVKEIKGLIEKNPANRLDIDQAIKNIQNIGSDVVFDKAIQENYVGKAKELSQNDPSALSLNADINNTKKKGIIEQYLVQNNPRIFKNQEIVSIEEEFNQYFKQDNDKVFVLLGEAGSGKSLSLQLRFLNELETWEYGKPLPIFFNMADEIDLDRAFRRINAKLGCNLKLDSQSNEIHLFVDSYDEGARETALNRPPEKEDYPKTATNKNANLVQEYEKKLGTWRRVKIIFSCRTDFVQKKGGDDLSDFMLDNKPGGSHGMRARYVAPIEFSFKKKSLEVLISDWLSREQIKSVGAKELMERIKRLSLKSRMRTGLMFNMVMKMLITNKDENFINNKPRGYEIYKRSLHEELMLNWQILFDNEKSKEKERMGYLRDELDTFFDKDETLSANQEKEQILSRLEKIGEVIAASMLSNNKNRISLSEIEELLRGSKPVEVEAEVRTEWKTLYQICKIMGLKMERRENTESSKDSKDAKDEAEKVETDIGFRHETYKNYFELRGFKRIFAGKGVAKKENNTSEYDEMIVNAVLNNSATLKNFELMRFFGEDLKYRDRPLAMSLRNVLNLEQEKLRQRKIKNSAADEKMKSADNSCEKIINNQENSRAAVTLSLLVAANFPFSGGDLSDLDLTGAYLRGGLFMGATFERTKLNQANMRYSNVSQAKFFETDLRDLELGIWPDLLGHSDYVNSVSFSSDGKKLITGSDDNLVKIWESESGECIQTLNKHSGNVKSVCFSPDGSKIATASADQTVMIWDTAQWNLVQTLKGHSNTVNCVCFSPEGKRLATASSDLSVKLWVWSVGKCKTVEGYTGYVYSVCFSPDGKTVLSASADQTLKILDAYNGDCLLTLKEHTDSVNCASFSPDGKRIVSGSAEIIIWDTVSGKSLQTLKGDYNGVKTICFSPDGKKLASGSGEETVKIWDATSGECIQILKGHTNDVLSVCFSPEGDRIASASGDNKVKIWNSSSGECVQTLKGHKDSVYSISLSPDGKLVASSSKDTTIKIWSALNGELIQTLKGEHTEFVSTVCFSPDGKLVATGSADKKIKIWNSASGTCLHTLEGHDGVIFSVCFTKDGTALLSASNDKTVKIWEFAKEQCLQTLKEHTEDVRCVCMSPDGKKIATASHDSTIKIWQFNNGECIKTISGHESYVYSVCFSLDGKKILSSSRDNTVRIWDALTGEPILKLEGHTNGVFSVSLSPDGKIAASGSLDLTVKIWDTLNGNCLQTLIGHHGLVSSVCFSPDGTRVISASDDQTVKFWDSVKWDCTEKRPVPTGGDKFWLSMEIQGFENAFDCQESEFKDCLFDNKSKKDNLLKKIIKQRCEKI